MPGIEVDDAALGARVRLADDEAFAELYQRYLPRLYDFAARLVRDRSAAEDVVQDTFIRAYEHRQTLRDPARVRSWLFSIAHNLAMNQLDQRRPAEPVEDQWDLAAPGQDPEAEVVAREAGDLVWAAAAGLEPRQYAVLDMSVRQELTTPEIAEVLGLPAAHAAVLVNRAREALGNAVRYLLVARRRDHCPRLVELVPAGVRALTPEQRSIVDYHMRHCDGCQLMARRLTDPAELLAGLALLPVPADLVPWRGWPARGVPQHGGSASRTHGPGSRLLHAVTGMPGLAVATVALIAIGSGGAVLVLHNHGQRSDTSNPLAIPVATTPRLSIRPASGPTGTPALAIATGFPPHQRVAVSVGGGSPACEAVTDSGGSAACALTVRWDTTRANDVSIAATGEDSVVTAKADFAGGQAPGDLLQLIAGLDHPSLAVCAGSYAVTIEGEADLYATGAGAIVATTTCRQGTASSPYEVATYVPVTKTLRQRDVLTPGTVLQAQSVAMTEGSVALQLSGYAPGDGNCCPSLAYTQTFTFPGGTMLAGPLIPVTKSSGSPAPPTPPPASPVMAAQIAAILTSKGVDCSSFAPSSSRDPGAVDQGHCGFPGVIEIAVFPNRDALAGAFVPFLRDFFCSSSAPLTDSYIDGGAYAIYTDTRTTPLVAAALGIPATKLC